MSEFVRTPLMPDPINPDRLAEAVDFYAQAEPVSPDGPFEVVFEAACTVLEAPTTEWCRIHRSKMVGLTGMCQAMRLDILEDVAEFERCEFGRVRLVAEDA